MRAAFSLLSLVIVMAIVLFIAKRQMSQIAPPAKPGAAASGVVGDTGSTGGALPRPADVGKQVQSLVDQAAQQTSAAASEATQ